MGNQLSHHTLPIQQFHMLRLAQNYVTSQSDCLCGNRDVAHGNLLSLGTRLSFYLEKQSFNSRTSIMILCPNPLIHAQMVWCSEWHFLSLALESESSNPIADHTLNQIGSREN